MKGLRFLGCLLAALVVGACAHPIGITPIETPPRTESALNPKKVAYVISDADRNREVITPGGGGDKVSYYPYRDLEKAIRDALRAVYSDVFVVRSATDVEAFRDFGVSYIFQPVITTLSDSSSPFTWPPTSFSIDLSCSVSSPDGRPVTRLRVFADGRAEFSEFIGDFGLAGRRAASQLSENLRQEVLRSPHLK